VTEPEHIDAVERIAAVRRIAGRGRSDHVEAKSVFSGLDWQTAGAKPRRVSDSVHELLEHMEFCLSRCSSLVWVGP
jgi:hypothetical protein